MVAKRANSTLCCSFGDGIVVADGDGDSFIKFGGDSIILCFIIVENGPVYFENSKIMVFALMGRW
jgi:hypothetical protein